MDWIDGVIYGNYVDGRTMFLRLFLSLVFGGVIGWEREYKKQPAGFRTHILICMGACLMMLVSIYIPQTFKNFQNGDPGRIAAQVVSGIGFLGAGAIFRLGSNIKGLTTAATIWVSAAIGLTVGSGIYIGAFIAVVLILFVLLILEKVESKYFPARSYKLLQINFEATKIATDPVFSALEKCAIVWSSVDVHQALNKNQTKLKLMIEVPNNFEIKRLYKELKGIKNVTGIKLGQDFN